MSQLPYYINVSARCLMSLMTRPGNLKYFNSDTATAIGKVLAYPWMIFWLLGFIPGSIKMRHNLYIQFMLFIVLYFIAASIGGIMWGVGGKVPHPHDAFHSHNFGLWMVVIRFILDNIKNLRPLKL